MVNDDDDDDDDHDDDDDDGGGGTISGPFGGFLSHGGSPSHHGLQV